MRWKIKMEYEIEANNKTNLKEHMGEIMHHLHIKGIGRIEVLRLENTEEILKEFKKHREQSEFLYFEEKAIIDEAKAIIKASKREE